METEHRPRYHTEDTRPPGRPDKLAGQHRNLDNAMP